MTQTRNKFAFWVAFAAVFCLLCSQGNAWLAKGHEEAAGNAIAMAGSALPEFFTSQVATIRHCSQDPDVWKMRDEPQLDNQEYPEHFINLELLGDRQKKLPATRYEFIELCYAKKLKPNKVGFVPYAVAEWTQRLTIAFAEHRKWPKDPAIQQKCAVYAGILAHYAGDLCQPLHTTVDYDGRVKPDGQPTIRGIHVKVDALIEKVSLSKEDLRDIHIAPMDDLMAGILDELQNSHALVDKVYGLESSLPALDEPLQASGPPAAFAKERMFTSARFIGTLYLTAWQNSAKLTFPAWHHRPGQVSTSQPAKPADAKP
jgi:hypothetical protein